MNTESYIYNPENPSNLALIEDLNDRKIWDMEQEIELLHEQVKSLKQELDYSYEFTNECLQELEYAKQELEWMNEEISNLISSKQLPMDEAKPLAISRLEPKRAVNESRAERVEIIDHSPAKVNEFERIENFSRRSTIDTFKAKSSNPKVQAHRIIAHSIQVTTESKQITVHSYDIQTRSREIREHYCEVRERLGKKRVSQKLLECQIGSRLPFRAIAYKRCSS
jgi:hypothetical protein